MFILTYLVLKVIFMTTLSAKFPMRIHWYILQFLIVELVIE